MRPYEVAVIAANIAAFLLLIVPWRAKARWMGYAMLVPAAVAAAQVLIEAPRWQLLPAYVLAAVFPPIGLSRQSRTRRHGQPDRRRRAGRWVTGTSIGLAVLTLILSAVLPVALPVFRFPRPTGPYDIGTVTYHWVDFDRSEAFTSRPDDRRELMVQIWYPATSEPSAPRAPYLDRADVVAPALARFMRLPGFTLQHLELITTNAVAAAPVANTARSYPVLVFLEGLGGYRQMNTFQVEELASHGYIVAAIDQPYTASMVVFPDGREAAFDTRMEPPHRQPGYDPDTSAAHSAYADTRMPYLAQDVTFTLDQLTAINESDPYGILTGRLDLHRTGLFGHSLGGIVGSIACQREPRLRACLLEDAYMPTEVVEAGLTQPTMWITRDADTMRLERQRTGGWPESAIAEHLTTMRSVYEGLPGDGYYVEVDGMFHVDMNDVPLLSPLTNALGISGPIGGQRAHDIINAYTSAFFDRHLRRQPAPLLDGPAGDYPDVHLGSRRDVMSTQG